MLCASLWGNPPEDGVMSAADFHGVMMQAKRQTVVGLLAQALMDEDYQVRLPKPNAIQTFVSQQEIRNNNLKVNRALEELCVLLQANSIKFLVVKGQLLAQFYPQPLSRQPGDIDFYCDSEHFDRARTVIRQAWNVTFHEGEEGDNEQHVAFEYKGIPFELHFRLLKFASSSVQHHFDEMIRKSAPYTITVGQTAVPTLPPVENLIFTFLHLYHHFMELGIGLRQICDMAVLLHRYCEAFAHPEEKARLVDWLKKLDYFNGFNAFGAICVDVLGLPAAEYPFKLTRRARSYTASIMKVVFKRGNFGMYGRKNGVRSGLAYYLETISLKLKHYLRFFALSRKENLAVLFCGIPKKITLALKR